jgi:hypothetical protein
VINKPKGSSIVPREDKNVIIIHHESNVVPRLLDKLTPGFDSWDNGTPFYKIVQQVNTKIMEHK